MEYAKNVQGQMILLLLLLLFLSSPKDVYWFREKGREGERGGEREIHTYTHTETEGRDRQTLI